MALKVWAAFERLLAADLNANFNSPAKHDAAWTPRIDGGTSAGVGTYTAQTGRCYRVGRLVFVSCRLVWTAHTGTGVMRIANLPFAIANSGRGGITTRYSGGTMVLGIPATNGTTYFEAINPTTDATINIAGTGTIHASGVYLTDDA